MKKLVFLLIAVFCGAGAYAQKWVELGTGKNALNANSWIFSVCADGSGNVYSAGGFTDSSNESYVAKWNGVSWQELGDPKKIFKTSGVVLSIKCDDAGNLYAAGSFKDSNGYCFVAKWNGNSWSELGIGSNALKANDQISSITIDFYGNIYCAGDFHDSTGYCYVAKWGGKSWSELGTGTNALWPNSWISTITNDNKGNIYAAGNFTDSAGAQYVAKWDGKNWNELGAGKNAINALRDFYVICSDTNGNVYAGVNDTTGSDNYIAKWNGSSWITLGNWYGEQIVAMALDPEGNVYAGSQVSNRNGKFFVAKWDGKIWSELAACNNSLNANSAIWSIYIDTSGRIYTAGEFTDGANYLSGHEYVAAYGTVTAIDHKNTVICGNVCKNNIDTFYAYGRPGSTFNWTTIGGKFISGVNKDTAIIIWDSAGIWPLKLVESNGSYRDSVIDTIIISAPSAKWTASILDKKVSFNQNDTNAQSYFWYFGDGDSSTAKTPVHTYKKDSIYKVRLIVTSTVGCINEYDSSIIIKTTTSISDLNSELFNLKIYPNPSHNLFHIQMKGEGLHQSEVSLYDILGHSIAYFTTNKNEITISATDYKLTKGIYILSIHSGNSVYMEKLVVE